MYVVNERAWPLHLKGMVRTLEQVWSKHLKGTVRTPEKVWSKCLKGCGQDREQSGNLKGVVRTCNSAMNTFERVWTRQGAARIPERSSQDT